MAHTLKLKLPGARYTVRTAPRPRGRGWQKCPAVSYGGARYFWYRRHPKSGRRQWYAYDRLRRQWLGLLDDTEYPNG